MSKRHVRWVAPTLLIIAVLLNGSGTLPAQAKASAGNVYLRWLRAAALHPATIWIGGTRGCANPDPSTDTLCPGWAMGSSDGGRTWHDATAALAQTAGDTGTGCTYVRQPAVLDRPGRQIAIAEGGTCVTASSAYLAVLYSHDGGRTWTNIYNTDNTGGYGAGAAAPAFAPVAPYQAWMVDVASMAGDNGSIARVVRGSLQDGAAGASYAGSGYLFPSDTLVPDPRGTAGVFVNEEGNGPNSVGYSAEGNSWTQVRPPHGVTSFTVAADPLVAGGLVATAYDTRLPPGRRWYSTDGGRHWTAGVCAGDYRAICPTAILPAGARGGAWVAINRRGVYTFRGDAGASGRATIALPAPPSAVSDAQGDLKPGDPIYLLARANSAAAAIYRSLDGGATWTRVRYPAPH